MSPELWIASDWPAAAVIAPRGPPKEEGGAARSVSRTPQSRAPAHANAALPSQFWHAHALPRHRVSTAATHIPPLTPLAPSWTPVDPHRGRPHRSPCGSSPKRRLSLPRVRISTPSNVTYMYRYHIDSGGSRERVALPLSARVCGQWAGCAPPRRPLQVRCLYYPSRWPTMFPGTHD